MTDEQNLDNKLTEALQEWASQHPDAAPILLSTGDEGHYGHAFTASDLAREVTNRTAFGRKQLEIFRHYARSSGDPNGDNLIRWIRKSTNAPSLHNRRIHG